jgi:hypothetical protein
MRSARIADQLSSMLLIGTFLLLLAAPSWISTIAAGLALAAALVEKYFAWRVTLDAELFTALAQHPQQAKTFDAAMAALLDLPQPPQTRSMASRWHGARRLLLRQALALGAQVLAIAAALPT